MKCARERNLPLTPCSVSSRIRFRTSLHAADKNMFPTDMYYEELDGDGACHVSRVTCQMAECYSMCHIEACASIIKSDLLYYVATQRVSIPCVAMDRHSTR